MNTAQEPGAEASQKPVTYLEAINMALADAMADDAKVVVLGEDVADAEAGGVVGVTRGLSARFGDKRVRSTPISEQAIIGAAIGASLVGWRPVAEIMLMNFTAVAMDMIVNHAAKLRFMSGGQTSVPITIRTMTGAGLGSGGQHADYLEAWFAHTAGMKVVAASNPADAYGLLRSCIEDPDPCLFIENLPSYWTPGAVPKRGERIPLGRARIARQGTDATVVTYARMVDEALAAAEALAKEGVSVEVVDLRTISPWDRDTVLASARKTGRMLVVHEAVKKFGVGAEIAAEVGHALFGTLKKPIERLGAPYSPVPFSKPLEAYFVPDRTRIATVLRAMTK
jgi:acetoin:2,6-dichlorophenolindophenol oxidoreductase subunit beta